MNEYRIEQIHKSINQQISVMVFLRQPFCGFFRSNEVIPRFQAFQRKKTHRCLATWHVNDRFFSWQYRTPYPILISEKSSKFLRAALRSIEFPLLNALIYSMICYYRVSNLAANLLFHYCIFLSSFSLFLAVWVPIRYCNYYTNGVTFKGGLVRERKTNSLSSSPKCRASSSSFILIRMAINSLDCGIVGI